MLVLAAIIVAVPAPITLLVGGCGSIIATTGVIGLPVIAGRRLGAPVG